MRSCTDLRVNQARRHCPSICSIPTAGAACSRLWRDSLTLLAIRCSFSGPIWCVLLYYLYPQSNDSHRARSRSSLTPDPLDSPAICLGHVLLGRVRRRRSCPGVSSCGHCHRLLLSRRNARDGPTHSQAGSIDVRGVSRRHRADDTLYPPDAESVKHIVM